MFAVLAGTGLVALVAVLTLSGVAWAADPLVVTKTAPSASAKGVAPTANIDAYFNKDVTASTVTSRTFKIKKKGTTTLLGAARSVDNTISPASTNGLSESVVTLNPNADLAPNTIYKVVVVGGTSGVKGVGGEILGANKGWTFTTSTGAGDTTPPETSIIAGPSGATNDGTPTFGFSGSDNTTPSTGLSYECRIDSGTFAACTSPYTASALSDGAHTFEVRAKDAASNVDGTPASRGFTVDTAAPDTSITSGPAEGATDSSGSASFGFSSTQTGSTFECKLDAGSYASCTSPTSYSNLADGAHTFSVRATDPAGNTDATPASRAWTVDATTEAVTIEPSPFDLGTTDVWCSPLQDNLRVTNNGPFNVTFADVSITGQDAVNFRSNSQGFLANNGPFTVLAGNYFEDPVTFWPGPTPSDRNRDYEATLAYKDGTGTMIGAPVTLTATTACLNV